MEHCLREDLNATAERTMAVLRPIKLTVTNYPEGRARFSRWKTIPLTPQGPHEITFSRHLWMEADDFLEQPIPQV